LRQPLALADARPERDPDPDVGPVRARSSPRNGLVPGRADADSNGDAVSGTEQLAYDYAVRQVRAWGYRIREVRNVRPLKKHEAHFRPNPILRRVKRTERAS
jgi:hypothetical protein